MTCNELKCTELLGLLADSGAGRGFLDFGRGAPAADSLPARAATGGSHPSFASPFRV